MKKRLVSLCLIFALILAVSGCGAKSECKELIEKFETACNERDVSAILECINPDKTATLKLVLSVVGDAANEALPKLYDLLGITLPEEKTSLEGSNTISLEVTEYDLGKTTGTVTCKMTLNIGDDIVENNLSLKVIKVDDVWYIDGLD